MSLATWAAIAFTPAKHLVWQANSACALEAREKSTQRLTLEQASISSGYTLPKLLGLNLSIQRRGRGSAGFGRSPSEESPSALSQDFSQCDSRVIQCQVCIQAWQIDGYFGDNLGLQRLLPAENTELYTYQSWHGKMQ